MKRECSYCNNVTRGSATHCGSCGRWFGVAKSGHQAVGIKTEHLVALLAGLAVAALNYVLLA